MRIIKDMVCDVIHLWDAPDVVRDYFLTGDIVHQESDNQEESTRRSVKWQPTSDEIRECCGVWIAGDETTPWTTIRHVTPDMVNYSFYEYMDGFRKIEPIPEQCIPKPEVERERYEWAGIIEEWM